MLQEYAHAHIHLDFSHPELYIRLTAEEIALCLFFELPLI